MPFKGLEPGLSLQQETSTTAEIGVSIQKMKKAFPQQSGNNLRMKQKHCRGDNYH